METLHIYTRVSSEKQLNKGQELDADSIGNQTKVGIEIATRLGMKYELHDEGAASSKYDDLANRPVLAELIKQIKAKKIKHLYVWVIDRLARNEKMAGNIKYDLFKNKVKLYTKDGVYDFNSGADSLMFSIISAVAEYDNQLRSTRFQAGNRQIISKGRRPGDAGYGYTKDEKGVVIINEEEAKIVKKMFEMNMAGQGQNKIQTWLNDNQIPTRRGGIWKGATIGGILSNEVYKGIFKYGEVEGTCPIIIEPDYFDKVQEKRKRNKYEAPAKTQKFYMLKGLVKCGRDGHNLIGLDRPRQKVYHCLTKRGGDYKFCGMKSINIPRLDNLIWNSIVDTLTHSKQLHKWLKLKFDNTPKEIDSINKIVANLKRDLKAKNEEEERLVSKFIEGKISSEVYDKMIAEHVKVKSSITEKLAEVDAKKTVLEEGNSQFQHIHYRLLQLDKLAKISDPVEKRRMILGIVDHIEVDWMEDKQIHVIKIYYKNPTMEGTYLEDGTDLQTGGNILQQEYEQLEPAVDRQYSKGLSFSDPTTICNSDTE